MNKCCVKKLVNKTGMISIALGAVLAIALVIGIAFGFNVGTRLKDSKTLTVSLNRYAYVTKIDEVEDECEKAFGKLDYTYRVDGEMSGDDCEIVYVFDASVSLEKLQKAAKALNEIFDDWRENDDTSGVDAYALAGTEKTVCFIPDGYVWKGIVAAFVFAAAAFIYVALRYNVKTGVVTALGGVVSALLTAAVLMITRIPVTASVACILAGAALVAVVASLINFNKIRENKYESISENIAVQEILLLAALLCGGLVLTGLFAIKAMGWFALASVLATLVATFVGMIYAPAVYGSWKSKEKKTTKSGYIGAKKNGKKAEETTETAVMPETVEEVPNEAEENAEEVAEETSETDED